MRQEDHASDGNGTLRTSPKSTQYSCLRPAAEPQVWTITLTYRDKLKVAIDNVIKTHQDFEKAWL